MIDTHVHLNLYLDREAVLAAAARQGIALAVATNRPSEYRNLRAEFADAPIRLGLGFHPEAAGSVYEEHELEIFRSCFHEARWISEVGLDGLLCDRPSSYFGGVPTLDAQRRVFGDVLAMGVQDKVLSVHSRGAEAETVAMLADGLATAVILHWFQGDRRTAERAAELGYFFSVNSEMLKSDPGWALTAWIPQDRLLLETDGPFGGRQPTDILAVGRHLALTRGVASDELLAHTERNIELLERRAAAPAAKEVG